MSVAGEETGARHSQTELHLHQRTVPLLNNSRSLLIIQTALTAHYQQCAVQDAVPVIQGQ